MDLWALNYDVLSLILEYIRPLDALRFSETCRTAHQLAMPKALEEVDLISPRGVSLFLTFLRSGSSHLPDCVRSLRVALPYEHLPRPVFTALATNLADLLDHTHKLQKLAINHVESLIGMQPRIASIICSYTSLLYLRLINITFYATYVLSNLKSSPREVYASTFDESVITTRFTFTQTMPDLPRWHLTGIDMTNAYDGTILSTSAQEVSWKNAYLCSAILPCAFPALRILHIALNDYTDYRVDHEISKDLQAASWKDLDYLSGPLGDIYDFPPQFPVRRISIDESEPMNSQYDLRIVRIIEAYSPVVLSLSIWPQNSFRMPPEFASQNSRMKYLRITLVEDAALEDNMNWLSNIGEDLRSLPLIAFCLCVRRPYILTTEDVLAAHDQATTHWHFPSLLRQAIPSARYIGLDLEAYPIVKPVWWHVTTNELDEGRLEMLSEETSAIVTEMLDGADEARDVLSEIEARLSS